jgi:hypothetical protein
MERRKSLNVSVVISIYAFVCDIGVVVVVIIVSLGGAIWK